MWWLIVEAGLALGLTSIVAGLLLSIFAGRLPVNPLLGYRTGYSFMDRRLWAKYTRLAGVLLVVSGIVAAAASVMGRDPVQAYLAILLPGYFAMTWRARREAHMKAVFAPTGTGDWRPYPAPRPPLHAILPPALLTLGTLYAQEWAGLLSCLPGALAVGLVVGARRDPLLLYNPWVKPSTMFWLLYVILLAAQLVMLATAYLGGTVKPLAVALALASIAAMLVVAARRDWNG